MSTDSNKNWSEQQKRIFEFFAAGEGNLVVRARAGTGKTTTIIEACGHAAHEDKILLAAFNKKIAVELQARVTAPNVEAKTLHALGFAFIRRQWSNVKVDADVDWDRAALACGKRAPDEMVGLVKKLASLLKSVHPLTIDLEVVLELAQEFDLIPEDEWEEEGWDDMTVCKAAVEARDLAKERDAKGRISFDDMVFIPIACDFIRAWYSMVVIDEAQDMNASQLLLAQGACKKNGRVVVVGDDRQAIYGFRGADSDGLDRLKSELAAPELGLTVTYRCARRIVDVARRLVPDFQAADGNPLGTVDSIPDHRLVEQVKPGDFVLSRANAPLLSVCLAILKKGIRCRIEGRDIAQSLRTIINSFKARSVPEFVERVNGWEKKQVTRAGKMKNVEAMEVKISGINDQASMLIGLAESCVSVSEILVRIDTLFGDTPDQAQAREMVAPTVVCSSVHRAKGLEADRVFILNNTIGEEDREEENIYYVAVTRARKHLTWVGEPKKRRR